MNIFEKLFGVKKRRPFSAWQIELTTRCPLQCLMCVRAGRKDVHHKDMALGDFRKIAPHLAQVETVVLEGWGESLMHPHLIECIKLVKEQGTRVGFVTSGWGLTGLRAEELVDAGVDFIGFSLAGATEETHNRIRVNSHLAEVLTAIKGIQDIKQDRGVKYPALHLVFLMLKDNIEELPRLPALAKQFRIDQIILLNIIQVSNGTQADQRVFMRTEESFEPLLVRAEKNAARLGIHLTRPALSPSDVAVCTENPLKNLYISVEGDVSPCVYLYPPVPSPFTTIFCSDRGLSEKVSFGNIFAVPFGTIWEGGEYRTFRNRFEARKRAARPSLVSLLDHGETRSSRHLPAPPAQCLRCHKILGF